MKHTEAKISIERFKEEQKKLQMKTKQQRKKVIVNAGLLKAGKSTLLNALSGKNYFASDVVRATVENSKIELKKYYLVDTPGLDAEELDTKQALEGYKMADVILFVHNIQEGELNQVEIDSIRTIYKLFGENDGFFDNVILVLTHKDQIVADYKEIIGCIEEQCQNAFKNKFKTCFCVNSVGYLKAIEENKQLLKQDSGILELLNEIDDCLEESANLQKFKYENDKNELIKRIEESIALLKKDMSQINTTNQMQVKNVKNEIKNVYQNALDDLHAKGVSLRIGRSSYESYGMKKNYKEYESKSAAKSAAKEAISDTINRIARELRKDAVSMIQKSEEYLNLSAIPSEIVNEFLESYEKIRGIAQKNGITLQTNFNVELGKLNSEKCEFAREEIKWKRGFAKNISSSNFKSVSRYLEECYINSTYTQRWVDGFFGGKMKWVYVYEYDLDMPIFYISGDAMDILTDDIADVLYDAVKPAFEEIKNDLEKQFVEMMDNIFKEISQFIANAKEKEKLEHNKKEIIEKNIMDLEKCVKDIESIKW